MALVGTILVALALLVGALNGMRRGATREAVALIGVLLGALLVNLWVERWGVVVAQRTRWQPGTGQWIAAMGLLWSTSLLAGYGSGSLLPRRTGRLAGSQRAIGALLGLVNWGLLAGLALRYTQTLLYGETPGAQKPTTWIRASVASRFLLERFDLILLAFAWGVAVIALVVTLVQLVRRLLAPRPPAKPASTNKPAASRPLAEGAILGDTTVARPAQTPPGMQPSFIEKPRSPSGPS